ncbi:MAG: hypothetical protein GY845_00300 [Planctomycetes bacterium]|nr:hypothetical protein [Planctomycetota bacterium]
MVRIIAYFYRQARGGGVSCPRGAWSLNSVVLPNLAGAEMGVSLWYGRGGGR